MPIWASEEKVWRHFSRAALESQYNLAQHPDRSPAYARYSAASAAVRAQYPWRRIAYGAHPREYIEMFAVDGSAAVLVFFHGGYWRALDAPMWSFVAAPFLAAGISVANVEYPLAPEMRLTDIVASARRAMIAIHRLGTNARPLIVSGHSAGGHLAAMMLVTDWAAHDCPGLCIASAVPISGVFELEPLTHVALNDTLRMTIDEARRQSPSTHLHAIKQPVLAIVGASETDEFRRQTIDFAAALPAARSMLVADANHFTVMGEVADSSSTVGREVLAFVRRCGGQA